MVESNPATRMLVSNRRQQIAISLLRLVWPLPGAITGAALGFHLYFRQPGLNTDTVAPLIFASVWAFIGMLSGAICTSIAAWLIERGVRRLFPVGPLIATSLTVLGLIGLCPGLFAQLEARLPVLLWPTHPKESSGPISPPLPSPCTQAPPSDPKVRQSWELECR
jgi:hypothetical protein